MPVTPGNSVGVFPFTPTGLHVGGFPDNTVVCHAYRQANGEYAVNGTNASDVAAVVREFERKSPIVSPRAGGVTSTYSGKPKRRAARQQPSGPTINIHGGQVQMATGDNSRQSINTALAPQQLVLVIRGITEMLGMLQFDSTQRMALEQAQEDAVQDITSKAPTGKGVKRFYDAVLRCVKQGGSAALVAAVTAATNGLLHDAEELVRALTR